MRLALIAAVVAVGFMPQAQSPAQAPAGPKVQITFEQGGLVTLIANGATVREVLAEWERQGGSKFVGAERLNAGAPLTLQFDHRTEKEVMASLLRQASGYILGPRRLGTIGASSFEVVYILPTSTPSTSGNSQPMTNTYQQPTFTPGNPDDELPPVGRGMPPPGPQQNPATPSAAPTPYPGGVSGVAVPVVPIVPVSTSPNPSPTPTPTPASPPGRAGGAGS